MEKTKLAYALPLLSWFRVLVNVLEMEAMEETAARYRPSISESLPSPRPLHSHQRLSDGSDGREGLKSASLPSLRLFHLLANVLKMEAMEVMEEKSPKHRSSITESLPSLRLPYIHPPPKDL